MTNVLIKIFNDLHIKKWKIEKSEKNSEEFFMIKNKIDMTRGKKITSYNITLYRDFSEEDKKYTGSINFEISPEENYTDIVKKIEDSYKLTSGIKNKYFPLARKITDSVLNYEKTSGTEIANKIIKIFSDLSECGKGYINSSEIFINKVNKTILNSSGLNINFDYMDNTVEFITTWKDNKESEIYSFYEFSEFNEKSFSEEIIKKYKFAEYKTKTQDTPELKNMPIIISGEAVKEFFRYFIVKSAASTKFEGTTEFSPGDSFGNDKINIIMDPDVKYSTRSYKFDNDGFPLSKTVIIEDGILKTYHGNIKYSNYIGYEPTGNIGNFTVLTGDKSVNEFKNSKYIELLSFSDFQIDYSTGDFGGEIRLGIYFDGEKEIPVTGKALGENIKNILSGLKLSSEKQQINNFTGPESIIITNL